MVRVISGLNAGSICGSCFCAFCLCTFRLCALLLCLASTLLGCAFLSGASGLSLALRCIIPVCAAAACKEQRRSQSKTCKFFHNFFLSLNYFIFSLPCEGNFKRTKTIRHRIFTPVPDGFPPVFLSMRIPARNNRLPFRGQ